MLYNQYPNIINVQQLIYPYDQQYRWVYLNTRHNIEQRKNIVDIVKSISDFCKAQRKGQNTLEMAKAIYDCYDAARKVSPDYYQKALGACLITIGLFRDY